MSIEQTVIYTARTSQEAHLLRNLLVEVGIHAVVENDLLERGSGVDMMGWATSARVVVAGEDAQRARQIALQFERKAAGAEQQSPPPGASADGDAVATDVAQWPRCPQCDARRSTCCRICGTAGTDFAPADMGFIWIPEPDPAAAACQCGPDGCGPKATAEDQPPSAGQPEPEPPLLLMCPTCDEPFTPEHPQVCEWCNHQFPDGFEVTEPQGPAEPLDTRIIAVIAGLLALMAGLVGYFMFVV